MENSIVSNFKNKMDALGHCLMMHSQRHMSAEKIASAVVLPITTKNLENEFFQFFQRW
jgi:hypothetical protein